MYFSLFIRVLLLLSQLGQHLAQTRLQHSNNRMSLRIFLDFFHLKTKQNKYFKKITDKNRVQQHSS